MADTDETPSQRQARLRREKREAKIKAGGNDRLDKITRLSGRTPESMRNEFPTPLSSPTPPSQPTTPSPNLTNAASPAQMQAQEEYLRQLLRAAPPQQGQGQGEGEQGDELEDPMMKMMNQLLGSMGGDAANGEGGLPFSPDDLAKATGLPSFVTDMFLGKQKTPPTPEQERTARLWNVVHTVFALLASIYVVFIVGWSVDMFGEKAPAPATFQNPFLVFVMGELLVQSCKAVSGGGGGKKGLWLWVQVLKDIARDGCIVVFVMGVVSWWKNQGLS